MTFRCPPLTTLKLAKTATRALATQKLPEPRRFDDDREHACAAGRCNEVLNVEIAVWRIWVGEKQLCESRRPAQFDGSSARAMHLHALVRIAGTPGLLFDSVDYQVLTISRWWHAAARDATERHMLSTFRQRQQMSHISTVHWMQLTAR